MSKGVKDFIAVLVIAAFVGSIIGGLAWNTERCRDREWNRVQEYGNCKKLGELVGYNSFEVRTRYLCFDSVEYIR